jgi:hypothetical protein
MTAVSWLKEELKKHKLLITPFTKGVNSLFEQAKAMEKNSYICEKCGHENMQQMQGKESS